MAEDAEGQGSRVLAFWADRFGKIVAVHEASATFSSVETLLGG
jgi:hypothetical protein